MATKKGNGHDPSTVEMVGLLRQVVEETRGGREELHAFRDETNARLERVDGRLANVERDTGLLVTHAHRTNEVLREDRSELQELRKNEARIVRLEEGFVRLEAAVFKKAS